MTSTMNNLKISYKSIPEMTSSQMKDMRIRKNTETQTDMENAMWKKFWFQNQNLDLILELSIDDIEVLWKIYCDKSFEEKTESPTYLPLFTRQAASMNSCLNEDCPEFFLNGNTAMEKAIEKGTFTAGCYSYTTTSNNIATLWSTDCDYCEKCRNL